MLTGETGMRDGIPRNTSLTQARLQELLAYDAATGVLTWIGGSRLNRGRGRPRRIGTRAGFLTPHGYRNIAVDGIIYREHRIIWLLVTGKWPSQFMDHRNRRRDDNRWRNLREATRVQNGQNRGLNKDNTTGVQGVFPSGTRFIAQITVDGEQIYLGAFGTVEQAAVARRSAKEQRHQFQPDGGL
jgi:hypothetical protein